MIPLKNRNLLRKVYRSFVGGMVTDIPPMYLQPYMSPNCQNVLPDEELGSLIKKGSNIMMGHIEDSNPITFMYTFEKANGTSHVLVSDGTKLWHTTDFATFTECTEEESGGTLTLSSTAQMQATTIRDKVWLVNGVNDPIVWDGDYYVVLDGDTYYSGLGGEFTVPNIPPARYIIFSQERVWMLRVTGEPSSLIFSSVNDTSGDPIAPDRDGAWPDANAIFCDRDDGDIIYGGINYGGIPYIFKSKSIGRVTGTDEYSYGYQRVISGIGTRFHECIVERDGYMEFIGLDGFYESGGSQATTRRVSDLVKSEFKKLLQPTLNEKYKAWNDDSDWNEGGAVHTNTETTDGVNGPGGKVYLEDTFTLIDDFADGNYDGWTVESGTWTAASGYLASTVLGTIRYPSTKKVGLWQWSVTQVSGGTNYMRVAFMYDSLGNYYQVRYYWEGFPPNVGHYMRLEKYIGGVPTTLHDEFLGATPTLGYPGTWIMKIERKYDGTLTWYIDGVEKYSGVDSDITSSQYFKVTGYPFLTDYPRFDDLYISQYPTTGTNKWTSAVTDIGNSSNVAGWGIFEAISTLNGQEITYRIRGAATAILCASATWHTIIHGQIIAEALTTPFIQVEATLVSGDSGKTPELESITVIWYMGGASVQKMVSIVFENRNLTSTCQKGYEYNNITWIRTKRGSYPKEMLCVFVPFDWKISAFCIFEDNLYGAASFNDVGGADEGGVLQLMSDSYGVRNQNYVGDGNYTVQSEAIDGFWEFKDEVFDAPMQKKKLMEVDIDYLPQGAGVIVIARSQDDGSFVDLVSASNIGTIRKTKTLAVKGILGHRHRIRLRNAVIDEKLKIYGVELLAIATILREST